MELVPMAEFTIITRTSSSAWIPELIAAAGPEVTETYIDFFTSTIRNRNTRAAYARACWQFFEWRAAHGLELTTWRAAGITIYLENDDQLEHAQQMAGHESPRRTKLYD